MRRLYRERCARVGLGVLALAAVLFAPAAGASALEFYVDGARGSDARSPLQAQSPSTPWKTIGKALASVSEGHTIRIRPGTYAEALRSRFPGVRIAGDGAPRTVVVAPPAGSTGLGIEHRAVVVENLTFRGGVHGIRAEAADGLIVRGCTAVAQSANGFSVTASSGVVIESSTAVSSGSRGIFIDHSAQAYLRNNLVYGAGEWGIDLENTNATDQQPPLSTGNVVAFNTVAYNGSASGGGIRLKNAIGEVRDNVVAWNAPLGIRIDTRGVSVHHNLVFGSAQPISPPTYVLGMGMIAADPGFLAASGGDGVLGGVAGFEDDDFSLRQAEAGQPAPSSPAVDAGSGPAATRDIGGTTRSDGVADGGVADLGYHAAAPPSAGAPPVASGSATYHVDASRGDDSRTKVQAQSPATPWRTIARALGANGAASGDVVLVGAGTYPESLETAVGGVALRATGAAVIAPPSGATALAIAHTDVVVDGFQLVGGVHGVRAVGAHGLVVRRCRASGQSANAFTVLGSEDVVLDGNVADTAQGAGISLEQSPRAYVRNNLVRASGEWGIRIDGGKSATEPAEGNAVAFNTVVGSGRRTLAGGIAFLRATGEIRDNVVSDNATRAIRVDSSAVLVHHNLLWGSATPIDTLLGATPVAWANLLLDPRFVDPAAGDYRLRQRAAGDAEDSPAVDAASGSPGARDISGSTRRDGGADVATADMGRHEDAAPTGGAPSPTDPPPADGGRILYVDATSGDDRRPSLDTVDPARPWRTIGRALAVADGAKKKDTVVVAAGTYAEAVQTTRSHVKLRASGEVVLVPPAGGIGIQIEHAHVTVDGFTVLGGLHGIRAEAADALVVRGCRVSGQSGNGIMVVETQRALVERNRVERVGGQGILFKRNVRAYARNNLVADTGSWAIHVDNGDPPPPKKLTGHVVAFNTVYRAGKSEQSGGIRFQSATGEIRDNIVAATSGAGIKVDLAPTSVHHNDVFGSAVAVETKVGQLPDLWANLALDPLFVDAPGGDFRLQQQAAGEAVTSPCVDAGSAAIGAADVSGSTRSDGGADSGTADLGYHGAASPAPRRPPDGLPTPTPTPVPTPVPPGAGPIAYVDCASGDDTRSVAAARDPATPWRSIGRAANALGFGDVVVVRAGTCRESVEVDRAGLTLRAETPGATIVIPPDGANGFNVQRDDVTLDGFVIRPTFQGVLVAASASSATISRVTLRRLRVEPRAGQKISANGIQVRDASEVTVDGCVIVAAQQQGILLKRVQHAYVRNNLVYRVRNDWGISLDNTINGPLPPLSTGNVLAFNTVHGGAAGLRLVNSAGEIRDNVVASNTGIGIKFDQPGDATLVHHNDAWGNRTNYDPPSGFQLWSSNRSVDPLFVDAAKARFELSQERAGDARTSPLADAGSGPPAEVDVSGSTRSDGVADDGIADMGYHAAATPSSAPPGGPGVPGDGSGAVLYVDCARGDDARPKWEAGRPWSPLATIGRALALAASGDRVVVAPGTCAAAVVVDVPGVTLLAATPLAAEIVAPAGAPGIQVRASNVAVRDFVVRSSREGVVVAAKDSSQTLLKPELSGLRIEAPPGSAIATNGIRVHNAERPRVDGCAVVGAEQQGIVVKSSARAWVRNNLVRDSGEWGIHVDNGDPPAPKTTVGNVVAFNTVVGSGRRGTAGAIRFQNATGEIRDNVVAGNLGSGIKIDGEATVVHHNLVYGSALAFDRVGAGARAAVWSNLTAAPLFTDAAGGDFTLQQVAAGQGATSPAVDAGSIAAGREVGGSTRADGAPDEGTADLGYHAAAGALRAPPAIATPPGAPGPRAFHVDAVAGDDERTAIDAQDPARPWRTIARALAADGAVAGDTVRIAAGTYAEAVRTTRPGVTLRGDGAVTIAAPDGGLGVQIEHPATVVEGLAIAGGLHGVRAERADDVVVRGCSLSGQTGNAVMIVESQRAVVDGNRVEAPGAQGILIKRAGDAYVRNNAVARAGEWGIHVDNGDTPLPPVTGGHVIAFNTVYGCGRTVAGTGGIRLQNATGDVRDNVVAANVGIAVKTDTAPVLVHHNAVSGSPTLFDVKSGQEPLLWSNVTADPLLVGPDDGDFALRQTAAGQAATSPAVDAGSGSVDTTDISGSTRTDGVADAGRADIGVHAQALAAGPRPSPAPTPAATPTPAPGAGFTLHVDAGLGDDGRTYAQAQSPVSPWRTIGRAIALAKAGDVVVIGAGEYRETVDVDADAITLRGSAPLGDVVLLPPDSEPGVHVARRANVRIENLVVRGGAQGILALSAPGIEIRGVAIVSPATNGIQIADTTGIVVDGSIVNGAGTQGILLRRSGGAYVRNNLVYGNAEWGISFDSFGSPQPPTATGNAVAFNTVHENGMGIRMLNASGEVRDNQITHQRDLGLYLAGPNLLAHHNNLSGNGRDRDQESAYADTIRVWSLLGANPRYVRPAGADGILGGDGWRDDDFRLRQLAGQSPASPLIDAGSGPAASLDIGGSTRSDDAPDAGIADVGFHYGAPPGTSPPAYAVPPATVQLTYYVDAATGDDSRSRATARKRVTPWRTISRALQQAAAGDTIVVLPGTYAETAQVKLEGLTLVSEVAGGAVLSPPAGAPANGITVEARGVTVDGFTVRGATNNGISALAGADRLAVRHCAIVGSTAEGIRAAALDDVQVVNTVVAGAGSSGILLRQVGNATLRNNLVYDSVEWGISIDASAVGGATPAPSRGHVVERNTLAFNRVGNLRLANALALVRDNLLTDSPGVGLRVDRAGSTLLNNGFAGNARHIDPPSYLLDSCTGCSANLEIDPHYVNPAGADGVRGGTGWADDDFRLAQLAAGQLVESEAVDAGSATVEALGATGSTATSGVPDAGIVDLGFHYGATGRAPVDPPAPAPAPTPGEGPAPTPVPTRQPTPTPLPTSPPTPTPIATPTPVRTPTPAATPTLQATPTPSPVRRVFHVDSAAGDDARSALQATSAATPWRSIARALAEAAPDDEIRLAPGTYTEAVAIRTPRITLRGEGARPARIEPPDAGSPVVRIAGVAGVALQHLVLAGGARGISTSGVADDLRVTDVAVVSPRTHGIVVGRGARVAIERTTVTGAGSHGIVAGKSGDLSLRDVRVYANGGAGVRGVDAALDVAFATVHANRNGGIRAIRSALSLRDSIVSENRGPGVAIVSAPSASISYTLLWENGRDLAPPETAVGPGVIFGAASDFVDADGADGVLGGTGWADDDLSLAQVRGGQDRDSAAVDAGSDLAAALGVTGSTAANLVPDIGPADLGAHR